MRTQKTVFTDRWLRSLKPLKPDDRGYRKFKWDAALPHFGIKHGGEIAFYVGIRSPATRQWVERHVGDYPKTSIAEARAKARGIIAAILEGRPPPALEGGTFAEMTVRYVAEILPSKRSGKACEQLIYREFVPRLGKRQLTSISSDDYVSC